MNEVKIAPPLKVIPHLTSPILGEEPVEMTNIMDSGSSVSAEPRRKSGMTALLDFARRINAKSIILLLFDISFVGQALAWGQQTKVWTTVMPHFEPTCRQTGLSRTIQDFSTALRFARRIYHRSTFYFLHSTLYILRSTNYPHIFSRRKGPKFFVVWR